MHDKPVSLEDFCVDALCDSVDAMCASDKLLEPMSSYHESSLFHSWQISKISNSVQEICASAMDSVQNEHRNTTATDVVIPVVVSDKVLWRMCEKNKLTNKTMKFFTSKRTTLKNVKIADCSVNNVGLEILKDHVLDSLKLINLKEIQFDRLITETINKETLENLQNLDLTGTLRPTRIKNPSNCESIADDIIIDNVYFLCHFKNLKALCVAETQFADSGLVKICENLKFLEYLDISHTRVSDIQPLSVYADQLRTLLMHRPRVRNVAETVDTICTLTKLEVLDVSDFPKMNQPSTNDVCRGHLGVLLVQSCVNVNGLGLKNLRIMDLSGSQANFDVNVFR